MPPPERPGGDARARHIGRRLRDRIRGLRRAPIQSAGGPTRESRPGRGRNPPSSNAGAPSERCSCGSRSIGNRSCSSSSGRPESRIQPWRARARRECALPRYVFPRGARDQPQAPSARQRQRHRDRIERELRGRFPLRAELARCRGPATQYDRVRSQRFD